MNRWIIILCILTLSGCVNTEDSSYSQDASGTYSQSADMDNAESSVHEQEKALVATLALLGAIATAVGGALFFI